MADGSALRKLKEIVQAQGGDPRAIDDYSLLPRRGPRADVVAPAATASSRASTPRRWAWRRWRWGRGGSGWTASSIPAVGFTLLKKVGDPVKAGEPVVRVHYNDAGPLEDVKARLLAAYRFGPRRPRRARSCWSGWSSLERGRAPPRLRFRGAYGWREHGMCHEPLMTEGVLCETARAFREGFS